MKLEYTCEGCGKKEEPDGWLALRLSADRRGVELRIFENCGPDDRFFCSETCAFRRISQLVGGLRERLKMAERLHEKPGG